MKSKKANKFRGILDGRVPVRMCLHSGGHGTPVRTDWTSEKYAWFDQSEEEAVTIANDTAYGLAAGLYTADAARSQRVAKS